MVAVDRLGQLLLHMRLVALVAVADAEVLVVRRLVSSAVVLLGRRGVVVMIHRVEVVKRASDAGVPRVEVAVERLWVRDRLTSLDLVRGLVEGFAVGWVDGKLKLVLQIVAVRPWLLRLLGRLNILVISEGAGLELNEGCACGLLGHLVVAADHLLNGLGGHLPGVVDGHALDQRRGEESPAWLQPRGLVKPEQVDVAAQIGLRGRGPVELAEAAFGLEFKRRDFLGLLRLFGHQGFKFELVFIGL